MPDVKGTVLEIDLRALEHNYKFLRSRLEPDTRFMAIVKAYAYGSDAPAIAQKLEEWGTDYFAVAYVEEGIALRHAGIKSPILVLHPLPVNFDMIMGHRLEPNIYSARLLDEFLEVAKQKGEKNYPIHLKFNTGLNRLGFNGTNVDLIKEKLLDRNEVKVVSIFSHLAASEDLNEREFTENQISLFKKIAREIGEKLGYMPIRHILNTSGILNYPDAQFDMVRSGIGLYGFGNDPAIDAQLRPIASLKTVISQIHEIAPGQTVGYNRAYTSDRNRVTATLPIGHADGIGRPYGNGKGIVSVNGHKAPIVGNVCMDMIMIDVTGINCKEGDEVLVFGKDPSAETFSANAHTISYELLTGISQRVKRVLIGDSN